MNREQKEVLRNAIASMSDTIGNLEKLKAEELEKIDAVIYRDNFSHIPREAIEDLDLTIETVRQASFAIIETLGNANRRAIKKCQVA